MYYPGALLVAFLLPPPDVLGSWYGVQYNFREICVPAGSVVDIPCNYTYPAKDTVNQAFWYMKWANHKEDFTDLRQRADYKSRAEYLGNKDHDCTLRIKDLRKTDSTPKYRFRFITDADEGQFSGDEMTLHVVGPPKVSKETKENKVTLTCTPSCPSNSNLSYTWYRNRQPVDPIKRSGKTLVIDPVLENDGHYSCALRGHEDQPSPPECVSSCWSVTYTPQEICAVRRSSVDIKCYYSYPSGNVLRTTHWFFNSTEINFTRNSHGEYLGNKNNDCSLRLKDLRTKHTGKYYFRFVTKKKGGTFSGKPDVSLFLTDPPKVSQEKQGNRVTLTCSSSCPPNSNPSYIWYRNRQSVDPKQTSGKTLLINQDDDGHYSCALRGHEDQPSPPECVSTCLMVTYTHQQICAVEGSSVDIKCEYSYPHGNVVTTLWYFNSEKLDFKVRSKHVEYVGDEKNDCSMRIKDLKPEYSGHFYFQVLTNTLSNYSGKPEVSLTVTGLLVTMTPETVTEGQRVTFTCSTRCSLTGNPTYIWYKDSRPMIDKHTSMAELHLGPVSREDSGSYSCAVKEHETHPSPAVTLSVRYAPRNVLASQRVSGNILEGSSVTLTCSSDANPPAHSYIWFKMERDISFQLGLGQKYNITNITYQFRGGYYCEAQNSVGARNSSAFLLDVHYCPKSTSTSVSPSGEIVEGSSVTLTCSSDANPPVYNYTWYKINREKVKTLLGSGQNHSITNISSEDMGQYSCEVTNTVGSSSSALILNVYYPPKNTSVMVNPSGEIIKDNSVSLICSSDANPSVHNYTWFMKIGDDSFLAATGTSSNLTVKKRIPEEDVLYYCVAQNKYGSHRSSEIEAIFQQTSVSGGQFAVLGVVPIVALVVVLVFVIIRKKKGAPTGETSGTVEHAQDDPNPVYEHVSAVPLTSGQEQRVGTSGTVEHPQEGHSPVTSAAPQICDQKQTVDTGGGEDDVQYASVQFKKKVGAPESTAEEQPQIKEEKEEEEEEDVQYASVKFRAPSSAVNQDEDNDPIYSNIKKASK